VLPPLTLTDTKPLDSFRYNGENYKLGTYFKAYNIILPASILLFWIAITLLGWSNRQFLLISWNSNFHNEV